MVPGQTQVLPWEPAGFGGGRHISHELLKSWYVSDGNSYQFLWKHRGEKQSPGLRGEGCSGNDLQVG